MRTPALPEQNAFTFAQRTRKGSERKCPMSRLIMKVMHAAGRSRANAMAGASNARTHTSTTIVQAKSVNNVESSEKYVCSRLMASLGVAPG